MENKGTTSMDLTTWMVRNDIVDQMLADAVGVTRPYINRIRNGEVHPNLGVALAIWEYTNRKIDLYQLLPRNRRPPLKLPALPGRPRGKSRKPPVAKVSRSPAAA
jgi:DNA-binding XRE family transcriptional regulator